MQMQHLSEYGTEERLLPSKIYLLYSTFLNAVQARLQVFTLCRILHLHSDFKRPRQNDAEYPMHALIFFLLNLHIFKVSSNQWNALHHH